jgi:hypothetical protein
MARYKGISLKEEDYKKLLELKEEPHEKPIELLRRALDYSLFVKWLKENKEQQFYKLFFEYFVFREKATKKHKPKPKQPTKPKPKQKPKQKPKKKKKKKAKKLIELIQVEKT